MKIHAVTGLALLLPAVATAAFLRVPVDHPDLAAALAAAADGDTVAVAASHVVAGGVTVPGRPLVVSGGWDDAFDGVVGRTPIAAGEGAPSLRLAPPVTGSPDVRDFAVAGGDGAALAAPLAGRYGGGVLVEGGAPVLRDLVVSGGDVGTGSELGSGGGLALIDSDALVDGCTFEDNRATWGGGVFVQGGSPTLRAVVVAGNACNPDAGGQTAMGAGVLVRQSDTTLEACRLEGGRDAVRGGGLAWLGQRGRTLALVDCEVVDNTADQDGGGLYGELGIVTISGGRFEANGAAPGADFLSGGGAYVTEARVDLGGVLIAGNHAAAGGGLTLNFGAEVVVRDCVFRDNTAALFGAALNYQSNDAGEISGNTMAANTNPDDAGVLNLVNTSPLLARNLVAFNAGGGVGVSGGALAVTCNDVFGNAGAAWIGFADPTGQDGNLAVDPLFCDLAGDDLTLRDDSPCLEAPGCGLVGALGAGCSSGVGVAASSVPFAVSAFPNPANPAVTLRVSLPAATAVTLTIHDARGRRVATLVDDDLAAGAHTRRWDGRDASGRDLPSGVYLYRLAAGGRTESGRVTILR